MKADKILDQVLMMLGTLREDPMKLQKILDFLIEEIYEEPQKKEIEIPEKFRSLVPRIAERIDAGCICYLNMGTLEMEDIHKELLKEIDPDQYEYDKWDDMMELKFLKWDNYVTFEPLDSHESFLIMEQFAGQLDDQKLQDKLYYALGGSHPFAKFKAIIDSSPHRQKWFDFKGNRLRRHVKELLLFELEK